MGNYYEGQIDKVLAIKKPYAGTYHLQIHGYTEDGGYGGQNEQTHWLPITPADLKKIRKLFVGRS
jgi:hypothetical protein